MKKYGFGIDVGGTTVKVGFFETSGKLLDKWEIKTNTANGGEAILPDIAKAIDEKLDKEGISKDDVQGVGIGVPGPVLSSGVVTVCVNLGWKNVDVAGTLSGLTGMKMVSSVPALSIDMLGARLSVPAIEFGKYGDKLLMIQSEFGEDDFVTGYFLLIPELESYDKILTSLGM